jgi:hypothetical protein
MTFSIRQQTVTVKRDDIIDALHQGLKKNIKLNIVMWFLNMKKLALSF